MEKLRQVGSSLPHADVERVRNLAGSATRAAHHVPMRSRLFSDPLCQCEAVPFSIDQTRVPQIHQSPGLPVADTNASSGATAYSLQLRGKARAMRQCKITIRAF